MINSTSRQLIAKLWPSLPFCYHLYRLGLAVVFLAALKTMIHNEKTVSPILIYLACVLFSAGFCLWLSKFVMVVVRHGFSRTVMAFVHAGVLVGAFLLARWIVALAMGLPSKDFDGTIAVTGVVCAVLLYILLLALACSAVAFGCLFGVWVMESAWLGSTIPGAKFIGGWLEKRLSVSFTESSTRSSSMAIRFMGHFVTGVMVAGFVWHGLQLAINASINDSQLMKHIAYYLDYQFADRYPGVEEGQRFVLHDNNVISLARLVNGQVEIAVGTIEPPSTVNLISGYK